MVAGVLTGGGRGVEQLGMDQVVAVIMMGDCGMMLIASQVRKHF